MMIPPLSDAQLKKEFGVEFVSCRKISQFAGLLPFMKFLERGKFRERLAASLGDYKAQCIWQVAFGILAGAEKMLHVEKVSKDPLIKRFLGKGVCATQVKRTLEKLSPSELACLHEFSLSLGLLDIVSTVKKGDLLTFDLDATAVERFGDQEGAEVGYLAKDQIAKCYQYLLVRCHQLNSFVYGTIRAGSTHSQNDFCGYLNQILTVFGGQWNLSIKGDSGFFNEEAFNICSANNTTFFIKAPMSEARSAQAQTEGLVWFKENPEDKIEYASYQTRSRQGYYWREVFKRIPQETDQKLIFASYDYYCVATNDLGMKDWEVFTTYNGRAHIENNIKELKYDYQLGGIVTESFAANDAITQATMILYQLMSHFKRTMLDKADSKKRLSTIRKQFLNVPGRLFSSARETWFRVYNVFVDKLYYARICARIKRVRNLFLDPYLLAGS